MYGSVFGCLLCFCLGVAVTAFVNRTPDIVRARLELLKEVQKELSDAVALERDLDHACYLLICDMRAAGDSAWWPRVEAMSLVLRGKIPRVEEYSPYAGARESKRLNRKESSDVELDDESLGDGGDRGVCLPDPGLAETTDSGR